MNRLTTLHTGSLRVHPQAPVDPISRTFMDLRGFFDELNVHDGACQQRRFHKGAPVVDLDPLRKSCELALPQSGLSTRFPF